ncbi:NAD-dependent epimerase/dehydratase family protein [Polynucleobacter paneuropaeus]|nr:NAD-dependent epimerase/dehydratase family protein [Polynucleobacter paneuropaeus]
MKSQENRILGNAVQKIFITGGSGFIGSHLCDLLLRQNYDVTVYDNFSNGRREFTKDHLDNSRFSLVEADCLDLERLTTEMAGHDLIWHLAANTDIVGSHVQPDRDLKDCVVATFNVLEGMRQNKIIPILFASSGAVYGKLCLEDHVKESAGPLSPMSTYAAGKIGSEAFIYCYCHLYGLRGWMFRFGNVIGSRVTHGVLYDFINRLNQNPNELLILGDGTQEKNYFLTEECIEGMAWTFLNSALDERNPCEVYNLGTASVTRVTEIAQIVVEEMGLENKTKISIEGKKYAWLGDQPKVHLSVDRVNADGWQCKNSSSEAVRKAVRRILGKSE